MNQFLKYMPLLLGLPLTTQAAVLSEEDVRPNPLSAFIQPEAQSQPGPQDAPAAAPAQETLAQAPQSQPQQAQQPAAPPSKSDVAFRALLESALPLSPDQIMTLHQLYDATQQAAAAPPSTPPTPISSSMVVSLEPGSQPPIIRLAAGFVSSLVFVDSTGEPWPITAYGVGNPETFNIQWDEMSNALFIQSLKPYAHGNLAVRLSDLNTPVMLSLVSGQKAVDYRVDLQVASLGPNAKAPIMGGSASVGTSVNSQLINVLDGIAPEGATPLTLTPNIGQAWLGRNHHVYIRTNVTVLSPAWLATMSSPNGTHVYEMMKTPLLLASDNGKTLTVEIKGL